MSEVCPGFVMDAASRGLLVRCWDILHGPHEKGICLLGNVGVGKTTVFLIMEQYLRLVSPELDGWCWIRVNAAKVSGKYSQFGERIYGALGTDRIQDLYIDDLGIEPPESSHFGHRENVFQRIILEGYQIWPRYLIHISSNLTIEQFRQRYGIQAYDRLKQMCHIIQVNGTSRR